jgi:hypothetical protein
MKRAWVAIGAGMLALCVLAVACGDEEEEGLPGTATPAGTATPETAVASPVGTPRPGQPSLGGEEVEHLVNDLVREVTFGDETVEEPIPDLIVRTAAEPGVGRGYRTVALFRDGRWRVTIYMRLRAPSGTPSGTPSETPSETPSPFLDLRADFYYDEETEEITGANGRGQFALTGKNPCSPEEIESGDCNLDEPAFP